MPVETDADTSVDELTGVLGLFEAFQVNTKYLRGAFDSVEDAATRFQVVSAVEYKLHRFKVTVRVAD